MWLVLALGCHGDPAPRPRPEPQPSGETGLPPLLPGCQLDPTNALRLVCVFERDGAGPIEARVASVDGGEPVVFAGRQQDLAGQIVAWDLLEDTSYDWELVDRGQTVLSGTASTDHLDRSSRPAAVVEGEPLGSVDRTVFSMNCASGAMLFALDEAARLRWYQPLGSFAFAAAFDVTDRDSVVVNVGRTELGEWTFDGARTAELSRPSDFDLAIHHSLVGRDGVTWALDVQPREYPDGQTYLVDGISRVSGDLVEHYWDVAEVLDPQGLPAGDPLYWAGFFPGTVDFGHANSLDVLPDGGFLVSFKHLSSILRLEPDGRVRWWIAGEPPVALFDGPLATVSSSVGLDPHFQSEHQVTLTEAGTLLVFDNGDVGDESRVVEIAVDEGALTADVIREWPLGRECPVQSSVFLLPNGRILASCAATKQILELDDTGVRRVVDLTCGDGGTGNGFIRAEPAPALARSASP